MSRHEDQQEIRFKYGIGPTDLEDAAKLFDEAFSLKFEHAIPDAELRVSFWRSVLNRQQILGAFKGDVLVGIALLSFANQPGFSPSAGRILFKLLGLRSGFRAVLYFLLFSKLDSKIEKKVAYLEALSVSQACRGKGIGGSLITELSSLAAARGCEFLQLKVTLENSAARRLYEQIGFRLISTARAPLLKFFTGVGGADLMQLEICSTSPASLQ